MIVNNFDIIEVKLNSIDTKTNTAKFKVICSDSVEPILINMGLDKGMEYCAKALVNQIKRLKTPVDPEKEGPLGNLSIVNILNDEEVVESVYKNLIKVDTKVAGLKRVRIASEYMKLFDQVNTMQEVLYKKKAGMGR